MRCARAVLGCLVVISVASAGSSAENRVTLEVITEQGISITALQNWNKLLQNKGADSVTLRSGRNGERSEIQEVELGRTKLLKVKAILAANEVLHLPDGAKFSKRNLSELPAWFHKVKVGGEDELKRQPGEYGMTAAEKADLLAKLSQKVSFETHEQPLADVLGRIGREIQLEFRASDAIIGKVQGYTARDELQGIASGTALAVLLRPYGLVMQPKREVGGAVHLHVLAMGTTNEAWPVGYSPKQSPAQVCPVLFQFIEVNINRTPLEQALAAITPRLKTTVLRDHYTNARDGIDTTKNEVRFPEGKTFYKKILDHILFQAMLSVELRVDEADTPILWITSAKRG